MDDLVKWALELVNKVSGPGKDVVRALQRIRQAGRDVDASMSRAAEAIGMRGMGRAALNALSGIPHMIMKGAGSILSAAASGTKAMTAGAVALAVVLTAGLAVAAVKMVGQSALLREDMTETFRVLTGSASHAKATYEHVLKAAKVLGQDPEDVGTAVAKLMQGGYQLEQALSLVQTAADMKRLNKVPLDTMAESFNKLRAKTTVSEDALLDMLRTAGVSRDAFAKAVGAMRGIDTTSAAGLARVNQLMVSGALSGDEAAIGFQRATLALLGTAKAGQYAADGSKTLSGSLDRLKLLPKEFFARLVVDNGPAKKAIDQILTVLDPEGPNGKALLGALGGALGMAGAELAKWATPENIKAFAVGLLQLAKAMPKVAAFALSVVNGVVWLVDAIVNFKANVLGTWEAVKKGSAGATAFLATMIGLLVPIAGIAVAAFGAVKWLFNQIAAIFGSVSKKIDEVVEKFTGAGKLMAGGIGKGFLEGSTEMLKTIDQVLAKSPQAANKAIDAHSPAKKFVPVGLNAMAGYALGIVRSPEPDRALSGALEAPAVAPKGEGGLLGRSAGKVEFNGDVNVYLDGDADEVGMQAKARVFGRMFRAEIIGALRSASQELGAPA